MLWHLRCAVARVNRFHMDVGAKEWNTGPCLLAEVSRTTAQRREHVKSMITLADGHVILQSECGIKATRPYHIAYKNPDRTP